MATFFSCFLSHCLAYGASLGILGLAFNLRAYDFVSQGLEGYRRSRVRNFYTKNIDLNEEIRLWMAVHDPPHEIFQFPEEVLPKSNSL